MDPTTPKKRKQTPGSEASATPSKRGRSVSETPKKRGFPEKMEDLSAEDAMMMKMKEEGHSWKEIEAKWAKMTGEKYTGLSVRYRRLVAALARVDDEHMEALMSAKDEADREIEEAKKALDRGLWALVTTKLEFAVGKKYPNDTVEKAFKKALAGGSSASPVKMELP